MAPALNLRLADWDVGYSHRIKCTKRVNQVRIRCMKIQWIIGDSEYSGTGSIWLTRKGTVWNYSYRIIRFNAYCGDTGGTDGYEKFVVK